MSDEEKVPVEEEEEEEVREEATKLEREYAPPETVEVKPKEEFEEVAEPLLDLYMKERGLSDRKQALIKLMNSLSKIGYKPPSELSTVRQYVNTMKDIINSIPDYPETMPIKAALAGESAVQATKMMRQQYEIDPEMKEIIRYATRMAVMMRTIDRALYTENRGNQQIDDRIIKAIEALEKRIEKLEGEKEREYLEKMVEERVKSVKESITELKGLIEKLGKKPPTTEEATAEKAVDKIVDKLDELSKKLTEKERDELIESLKKAIEDLPEKLGEYTTKKEMGLDAIDKLLNVIEKLEKRFSKKEVVSETDWKSTAITTIGDVIRDVVPKLAESREEEEEIGDLRSIIDMKVLEYATNVKFYGDGRLNIKKCAEHLGLTIDQVKESLERLVKKGLLTVYKPPPVKEEVGAVEVKEEEKVEEEVKEEASEELSEEKPKKKSKKK